MIKSQYLNISGPSAQGRGEGLMVFVPASTSGILVYFGGGTQDPSTREVFGAPMDNITIYDIAAKKWYAQEASGQISEQRTRFCGGVAWPDDKSSSNIYLYGGHRPNAETINGTGIISPSLYVMQYSQQHTNDRDGRAFLNATTCDSPVVQAQHNINLGLNNLDIILWSDKKGGANATSPLYTVPTRTPTATSTPTPTPTPTPPKKKTNTTVIMVGWVVGGILLLVAAIASFVLLRWGRAKNDLVPDLVSQSNANQ
ncbi:uncharacterized protein PAC_14855 [Phialocephala subalpina]|uniref:Kelch repeat-containing protein n=1 Tax=Phialocephala subalpina TaxID=576137 RepID=A0A1L7XIT7_9HELO|nr:uncharacterized protein PAC_14855 [Phialocephala subalpina]